MANQSAAVSGYGLLTWHPGNPALPTLPGIGDPSLGKLDEFGRGADKPFISRQLPFVPPIGQGAAAPASGFADWYVNQIWVTPTPIDFGDIANDKDVSITIYSTYKTERTLSAIDIPVDAIELIGAGSPALPDTLLPFGDKVLTFRALQAGPDIFDDDITFNFDVVSFDVRTVGRRVLLLFAAPEAGMIEQLGFATDLMRSKNGFEQAFSLRKAPRSTVQYKFRLPDTQDQSRTRLETLLFGGSALLPIGVQYWFESRRITSAAESTDATVQIDTSNLSISIGETFVFTTPGDINVLGVIDSFDGSSITFEQVIGTALPLDTFGMPVRFGHMQAPAGMRISRKNLQDLSVTIRTEAETDIGAIDTTYFDLHPSESPGRPILKERCTLGVLSGAIDREESRLDSQTGRMFVTSSESLGEQSSQAVVFINSMAQLHAWRKFLHFVRGSWGTFYAPTFQNDLPLDAAFALGGNTFDIPDMGIDVFLGGAAPKRDLRIVTDDGVVHYRRITDVTNNGNGTETVTLDDTVGTAGFSAIADTVISWMHLVRIDGDTATFNHRLLGEADLIFRIRTVKE